MEKILFLCTGNTCRSPMAQVVLKNKLERAGVKSVKVTSAGLLAENGRPMTKNARKALKKAGYEVGAFKSKKLTERTLFGANVVITMTDDACFKLRAYMLDKKGKRNVYPISKFIGREVPDPYGGDLSVYEGALKKIEEGCEKIFALIKQNLGG